MTSQFLPVFRNNADYEIEELNVQGSVAHSFDELCDHSQLFRIRGIAEMLMTADARSFRKNLHLSAGCFARGLRNMALSSVIVSKSLPFLDAIAVQDLQLSSSIAKILKEGNLAADYEYPEDYYYYQYLVAHVLQEGGSTAACFARWAEEYGNEDDPRFMVVQAFEKDDEESFHSAFDMLLQHRRDYCLHMRENEALGPEWLETEGRVFIEGIVWAVLAKERNYNMEKDYLFVPSIVFDAMH
ncbi:MAG: hypothetical protein HKN70_07400 [Gammaproteobacteria bacterium]|nr:hypothetical protein [Gammaproteobacteria bacterium]